MVTGPAAEPITVAQALAFLRLDTNDEETLLSALVIAARRYVENYTGRSLINTTWALWRDGFGRRRFPEPWWDGMRQGALSNLYTQEERKIILPKKPLVSVTSLSTFALDDTESTYAASNYIVNDTLENPEIVLRDGAVWPANLRASKAVKITFVAGYGASGDNVPDDIKLAMRQLIAHWFEHRDAVSENAYTEVPMGVTMLLSQYRTVEL